MSYQRSRVGDGLEGFSRSTELLKRSVEYAEYVLVKPFRPRESPRSCSANWLRSGYDFRGEATQRQDPMLSSHRAVRCW